ncbi:hypothetical protein AB6D11_00995 [Vibrio splendidus]
MSTSKYIEFNNYPLQTLLTELDTVADEWSEEKTSERNQGLTQILTMLTPVLEQLQSLPLDRFNSPFVKSYIEQLIGHMTLLSEQVQNPELHTQNKVKRTAEQCREKLVDLQSGLLSDFSLDIDDVKDVVVAAIKQVALLKWEDNVSNASLAPSQRLVDRLWSLGNKDGRAIALTPEDVNLDFHPARIMVIVEKIAQFDHPTLTQDILNDGVESLLKPTKQAISNVLADASRGVRYTLPFTPIDDAIFVSHTLPTEEAQYELVIKRLDRIIDVLQKYRDWIAQTVPAVFLKDDMVRVQIEQTSNLVEEIDEHQYCARRLHFAQQAFLKKVEDELGHCPPFNQEQGFADYDNAWIAALGGTDAQQTMLRGMVAAKVDDQQQYVKANNCLNENVERWDDDLERLQRAFAITLRHGNEVREPSP